MVLQMNELQSKLKVIISTRTQVGSAAPSFIHSLVCNCAQDAAEKKKTALVAAYQQMRELLDQDERVAQHQVDCELEAGQTKLRDLMRRFTDNSERMKKAREELDDLMSRSQTAAFLQVGSKILNKSHIFTSKPNKTEQVWNKYS